MKKIVNYFTKTEWFLVAAIIAANAITGGFGDLLGAITSITGVLCVILAAKGKISNFYFGIINVALYAFLSYQWGLYGDTMLNGLFYLPTQFIGIYMWRKHLKGSTDEVETKKLTRNQTIALSIGVPIIIIIFAQGLIALGGSSVYLDATSTILSILGQILMLGAFTASWYVWIAVNTVSIIMWAGPALTGDAAAFSMVAMFSLYLLNSYFGLRNWRKLEK